MFSIFLNILIQSYRFGDYENSYRFLGKCQARRYCLSENVRTDPSNGRKDNCIAEAAIKCCWQGVLATTMHSVSSKDIQKARRIARRTRSAVACARCKASKVKCNDYRPCKQCTDKFNPCHEIDMQGSMLGSSKKMESEYENHASRPLTSNLQSRSEECIENLENANRFSFPGSFQASRSLPTTQLNLYSTGNMFQTDAGILNGFSPFPLQDFLLGRPLSIQPPPHLQNNLYAPFSQQTFLPSLIPRPSSVPVQMTTPSLHGSALSAPLPALRTDILSILLANSPTAASLLPHFRL